MVGFLKKIFCTELNSSIFTESMNEEELQIHKINCDAIYDIAKICNDFYQDFSSEFSKLRLSYGDNTVYTISDYHDNIYLCCIDTPSRRYITKNEEPNKLLRLPDMFLENSLGSDSFNIHGHEYPYIIDHYIRHIIQKHFITLIKLKTSQHRYSYKYLNLKFQNVAYYGVDFLSKQLIGGDKWLKL